MDDFILPEDVDEEIQDVDTDADENKATASTVVDEMSAVAQEPIRNLTVGRCAEVMEKTLQKYKEVKQRIAELDQLAMQLSFGIRLQAEMDKCATERKNFPLRVELKRQRLSSGASLLFIRLRNDSTYEMIQWHLTLTALSLQTNSSTDQEGKIFTKVIPIERLTKYSEFTHEIFCTNKLPVPVVFRTQLFKCIYLSGNREPCAFRIALEPIYLTHWDMAIAATAPETSSSRAVLYERTDEEQKLTLPEALVYLLCGEKPTEASLLSWITAVPTNDRDSISCTISDDDSVCSPLTIQVKRRGLNYDVVLKMRNAKLRSTLINELQLRILIRMQYVWKELKEKQDCELLLDISSLSNCFASMIAKYIR